LNTFGKFNFLVKVSFYFSTLILPLPLITFADEIKKIELNCPSNFKSFSKQVINSETKIEDCSRNLNKFKMIKPYKDNELHQSIGDIATELVAAAGGIDAYNKLPKAFEFRRVNLELEKDISELEQVLNSGMSEDTTIVNKNELQEFKSKFEKIIYKIYEDDKTPNSRWQKDGELDEAFEQMASKKLERFSYGVDSSYDPRTGVVSRGQSYKINHAQLDADVLAARKAGRTRLLNLLKNMRTQAYQYSITNPRNMVRLRSGIPSASIAGGLATILVNVGPSAIEKLNKTFSGRLMLAKSYIKYYSYRKNYSDLEKYISSELPIELILTDDISSEEVCSDLFSGRDEKTTESIASGVQKLIDDTFVCRSPEIIETRTYSEKVEEYLDNK
jgi:hypothetical protein